MQFTPTQSAKGIKVPYYEDADGKSAPGYTTEIAAEKLQLEISTMITKMGGSFPVFREGKYLQMDPKRYGYEVDFFIEGKPAMIQMAGLPMRRETDKKRDQVLRHALYTINTWLKTMYTSMVFTPGYAPLVQFILLPGTKTTVGEAILKNNAIPNLNPSLVSGDVITVRAEVVDP